MKHTTLPEVRLPSDALFHQDAWCQFICTGTRALPSFEAVRTLDPSAENSAEHTAPPCPDNVCVHSPVELSQILAELSPEAVRTLDPSAENTADHTAPPCTCPCPDNVCVHSPAELSQILAELSFEAVRTLDQSAENTLTGALNHAYYFSWRRAHTCRLLKRYHLHC